MGTGSNARNETQWQSECGEDECIWGERGELLKKLHSSALPAVWLIILYIYLPIYTV